MTLNICSKQKIEQLVTSEFPSVVGYWLVQAQATPSNEEPY